MLTKEVLKLIENTPEIQQAISEVAASHIAKWRTVMAATGEVEEDEEVPEEEAPAPKKRGPKPGKGKKAKPVKKAPGKRGRPPKAKTAAKGAPKKRAKAEDGRTNPDAILHVLGLKQFEDGGKTGDLLKALEGCKHSMNGNIFNTVMSGLVKKSLVERTDSRPYTYSLPTKA
jgi:hypothetical protein